MWHHAFVQTHPEPTFQRYITKPQTPRFSSHTSLFWTLPEQLPMLHHTCEPTHPEPTSQDTLQTSDSKMFISHIPVLNFAGKDYTTHVCQPILNQRSKDKPQNLRPQDFHLTHPSFELCRSTTPYYTTHVSQPILNQRPKTHYKLQIRFFSSHTSLFWTLPEQLSMLHYTCEPTHPEPTFQRYITKPQTPRFSSYTSLFWTLPEQLPMLHHTCEPTHPEPTSQDTLQTSDPKIFISHIPVLNFAGTDYTTHVCQPILNQRSKDTPQNLRPQDFHLTHTSFELCRSGSPYYTTHVSQPILNQRPKTHYKLQFRFFFISHIPVLNFAGTAFHVTPHMWANPSWTNVPRHTTNFRSENFHLTHPCFELCRNSSPCYTTHVRKPILNQRPKTHYKLQIQKFSSHTSLFRTLPEQLPICFELCRSSSPCYTTHVSQQPTHPEPMSQDTLQTSDPKIFISHIPVLNFAGADYTTHVCQPWTNVPKIHHKTSDPKIFISHICFELCRNSSPCYATHVSQPILNQRPKIHHKRLMTQFCKPILIQPPKIHLSKLHCSPYRRQKCRALQEDTVEWKPVCDLQDKNGSQ